MISILAMAIVLSGCPLTRSKSDPRKDLGDALRRLQTAYPYRLTEITWSNFGGSKTPDTTRVTEFAAADRSHVKMSGGIGQNLEQITIGPKKYDYRNGQWSSWPSQDQEQNPAAELEKKLAEGTTEVKYLGAETVNGVPCSAYSFVFEITLRGLPFNATEKAWIGSADGLPHQIDSESKSGNFTLYSHLTYEYNVNFKIEPPM
jgi:hypothetical protein